MSMKPVPRLLGPIAELGALALFSSQALRLFVRRGVDWRQVVDQMYAVGVRSISTTTVTGLFVGAIMAVQINLELRDFGAQGALGGLATSVTIRTVGPVLIAFILSGKVGAYTSAELGTMRVTDQMDALRCLGTDPVQYLILPRLIAVVLSSFCLLIVGLMMTIAGGVLVSALQLSINPTNYTEAIPRFVTGFSVWLGVVKSFCFGTVIAVLACYRGYTATGGAVGVGRTVKATAVQTLVAIIVIDYLLTLAAGVLLGAFS